MNIPAADLLVSTLRPGDAVGEHTMALARLLAERGARPHIHTTRIPAPLPPDISQMATATPIGAYHPAAELTLLEYAIWFPLAERFRERTAPGLFWYHGVTPPHLWAGDFGRELLITSQLNSELVWFAHHAVAVSPYIARELHEWSGYPLERIAIVPNGVAVERFRQPPSPAALDALRSAHGLHGKEVLLYVGRLAGNKRIDLLLEALAQLRSAHPALHLLIVGDGESSATLRDLKTLLQEQALRLGLEGAVSFTGRVPDQAPYYHLARVFLLPSEHEGFGVPLIEAMAAGIPVIAARAGAMPWLVGEEGAGNEPAGLLFAPGDSRELAGQLHRLLGEEGLAAALTHAGARRAADFSLEAFRRNATAAIDETMARRHEPLLGLQRNQNRLYATADVAMRSYRVRSALPVVGPLIERLRTAGTSHLKEAYLDRIIERQVAWNRQAAGEVAALRAELAQLRAEIARLRAE
jgi:glycosyltransferase involved in cell wall biosynthesis